MAEDGWSATWSPACCRCSFYLFGERNFLFVYLKKFGIRLHQLLAWRFLLSAPCTLQCLDDLSPTQLPGCADRCVPGQHSTLGSAPTPSCACLCLIWHLPSSPWALLCASGCCGSARLCCTGWWFSPLSSKCNGRGNWNSCSQHLKNFWEPLCFLWFSELVDAAYEG